MLRWPRSRRRRSRPHLVPVAGAATRTGSWPAAAASATPELEARRPQTRARARRARTRVGLGERAQRQSERPGGVGDQAQVVVDVSHREAHRHFLGPDAGEPGALEQRRGALGAGHAEDRRARRLRRWQVAVLDQAHRDDGEERVLLHRSPHGQSQAPPRAQDAACLGECPGRVDRSPLVRAHVASAAFALCRELGAARGRRARRRRAPARCERGSSRSRRRGGGGSARAGAARTSCQASRAASGASSSPPRHGRAVTISPSSAGSVGKAR